MEAQADPVPVVATFVSAREVPGALGVPKPGKPIWRRAREGPRRPWIGHHPRLVGHPGDARHQRAAQFLEVPPLARPRPQSQIDRPAQRVNGRLTDSLLL